MDEEFVVTGAEPLYQQLKQPPTIFKKQEIMQEDHYQQLIGFYEFSYADKYNFTHLHHQQQTSTSETTKSTIYVQPQIKTSAMFQSDQLYSSKRRGRSLKGAYIQALFLPDIDVPQNKKDIPVEDILRL
jgi:hypothetical protein